MNKNIVTKNCIQRFLLPVVLLVFSVCMSFNVHAQVQSPCDANPFCSDSSYNFPNAIAGTLPAGVNTGCLTQAPAPVWYWMQIGTAGTMQLTIAQQTNGGIPIDVDFAMYGPFTDLPSGCAAILAGAAPLQCSFSVDPTETIGLGLPGGNPLGPTTPPAAQVGQVYVVLITNFAALSMGAASAGNISFSQTAGTGSADCAIICRLNASNSGDVCMGLPVTLTATNSDSSKSYTYHWTGLNNTFTSNSRVATFVPTAPGVYNFSVIAVTQNGDTCQAATSVTIFPKANVALIDNSDRIICNTGTTSFIVNAPTAGDTYQWYDSSVAIPGATTSQLIVSTTGLYKLVATNANGCSDSTKEISVKLVHTDIDFDFQITKACNDDTVRFTNLSEPGRYWWDYGDQTYPLDTIKDPTHIYQDQSAYIVKLVMKDLDGCMDSTQKVVDVTHPLQAVFSTSADTVCLSSGTVVNFTDASIGNITNWYWNFGEGLPSAVQNPSYVFTQPGSHNIRLVVKDSLMCLDTTYRIVQVDSTPYFTILQDKHAICAGESVTFNSNYYATTIRNIAWNFGDGGQWSEVGDANHHYETPGVYWITADADFGICGISHSTDSVVVNAFPKVDLGPDSVLCLDGPSITIRDSKNVGNPAMKWQWNTGATSSFIEVVHPGTYSVTASINDCATTESVDVNKDCYTDIPNAFTPNGDGVNDYFYPRALLSKGVVGFSMTVYNRWGEKIFETTNPNGRGWDGRFNEKIQPMGVYIYQIDAVLKNGRTESYKGNVTLVR